MSETITTSVNMAEVRRQIEAGYIGVQKHPEADLYIYNYTQRAQFDSVWTPETMACRGLILDGKDNIVARPFPKFFNADQPNPQFTTLPCEPFEVFDKLDGSLGIIYPAPDGWAVATRGSFVSDQAIEATKMLRQLYPKALKFQNVTLLVEIIYPANRIVVNYGGRRELVLLTAVHKETGWELPYEDLQVMGYPVVERFDGLTDFDAISKIQDANREGFVIRFTSGLRVKVKFDEYKRLHKLLTGVTPRHIWELLKTGTELNQFAERVPDEFHAWIKGVEAKLRADFATIEGIANSQFRTGFATRKDAAEYFKQCQYPGIMFSMLDGKPYADAIWKLIYPAAAKAFKCDEL